MGNLLRGILYVGLFSGIMSGIFMRYVTFNGEMPPDDVNVDVVMIQRACNVRAGPSTDFQVVGSTKRFVGTRSMFYVTDARGDWRLLRKGKLNAWVHQKCILSPSAGAS
jgi:hypothetical protein